MKRFTGVLLAALLCASTAQAALQDIVTKGSTSRSVTVDIIDSTDGTPETGVVFNTSGIDLWYRREGAVRTAITEATLAALTTAWSSGGFLHVSDGTYRLDLPDAAFATGANYVDFGGTVTGMIVIGGRVRLVDYNLEVAALVANVTQFNGSNATSASGRPEVNVSHWNSTAVATPATAGYPAVTIKDGTGTGEIDTNAGAVVAVTGVTNLTNAPTAGDLTATMKTSVTTAATAATPTATVSGDLSATMKTSVTTAATAATPTVVVGSANTGSIENQDFATTPGAAGGLLIAGTNADFNVTAQVNFIDGFDIATSTTNRIGFSVAGNGTGDGARFTGGATGHGLNGIGGSSSGAGVRGVGTAGNSPGATWLGQGSAAGEMATGGATGPGFYGIGGSTSGLGFASNITHPSGSFLESGLGATGSLLGTHTTTTMDLGANAPAKDIVGSTIVIPSRNLYRTLSGYVTGTGVGTFSVTTETLANGDDWYLWQTPPGAGAGVTPADIWTYTTRNLTSGTNIALAKGTGITGFNDLSTSQVENSVWDAAFASHVTAGTAGLLQTRIPNAAPGANGGLPTVNASNQVAGVSGNVLGSVASVTGNVGGSVGSVTGNVGGNVVGNVNGSVGSLGTTAQTNAQAAVEAALNAHTVGGENWNELICRMAAALAGASAADPTANGGNGNQVFSNAANTTVRFTMNFGTDPGDRTVSLGATCGN